jgi:hypothetical protein
LLTHKNTQWRTEREDESIFAFFVLCAEFTARTPAPPSEITVFRLLTNVWRSFDSLSKCRRSQPAQSSLSVPLKLVFIIVNASKRKALVESIHVGTAMARDMQWI